MFDTFGFYTCIKCTATVFNKQAWELHQKMCNFCFLKWARRQGLTQHWTVDQETVDNFQIGNDWERGRENRHI